MKIFVFGNPDLKMDALPLQLLPVLRKKFPSLDFVTVDPNEEWEVPEYLVVIDTVLGLSAPEIFSGLNAFRLAPNLTLHDFDAYANLRLLQKLGQLKRVKILGLPAGVGAEEALKFLEAQLSSLV